jgi:putative ABC transport system substrate-binding protein
MERWSRRQFAQRLGGASLVLVAGCGRLPGQMEAPRVHRIGVLTPHFTSDDPVFSRYMDSFRQGLAGYGYVAGQNVSFEMAYADGGNDRLPVLAANLVQLPVELIVADGPLAPLAAKQATTTLPIVFVQDADPVASGAVASLARPGGNATGLSTLQSQFGSKRVELLHEAVPGLSRLAVLWDAECSLPAQEQFPGIEHAAQTLGLQLQSLAIHGPDPDIDGVLQAAVRERAEALLVVGSPRTQRHGAQILDFAAQGRLPTMGTTRDWVVGGALMTYASNLDEQWRRAAYYVDAS